ncbi:YegS/Rv2252/BmrU family lipid kinase [Actinosynnema sp. NPDC047251]|uniref:Diacylglycerol kinase n=1 Tax=Saccharothrix espanaensis (strain ATCC 51144 / DSM 44229 / JCM 9112 / NBRC 15066 / NRRL 15764) TaxID=1179773 RepID=K0JZ13_SACES|nr:YegS/Rv2252/BmrU family lipid kinase [Saccharothrix espanaensis]CCH30507.1 Diacylglycerol kinase [Saccharothrix espanaensis DSM 44229]
MTRAALLVCPTSGKGRAARLAGTVAARLRTAVDSLDLHVAGSAEGTADLARQAVDDGVDVLVVLGGDGGAHLGVQACAGTSTALAVVPAGTGNDLATALGTTSVDDVVRALHEGRTRPLDLGRLGDGTWFATVLCAGFDSAVNERANGMRWPAGPRRYDLAILAELATLRPEPLVVATENGRLELDALLVAVGNTGSYGGGIPVCPDADDADGLFDITVVAAAPRRTLLRMLPTLRTGRHVDHPAVRTLRAKSVTLSGPGWVGYADGERLHALPLEVSCRPAALTVVSAQVGA